MGEEAHSQPLGVILLRVGKQGAQRVVARNDEARKVCEELAANVENDEEEVESSEADDGIGLGNAQLLLEVVQGGVFGELCNSSVSTQGSIQGAAMPVATRKDEPPCQGRSDNPEPLPGRTPFRPRVKLECVELRDRGDCCDDGENVPARPEKAHESTRGQIAECIESSSAIRRLLQDERSCRKSSIFFPW